MYELFRWRGVLWRAAGFYRILAAMRSANRGFFASVLWLGLALGFTSALADFLEAQHGAGPIEARDVQR